MSDDKKTKADAEAEGAPASKKSKVEAAELMKSLIKPDILSKKDTFKKEYGENKPYSHAVLPDLLDKDFLTNCVKEIKDESVVTFKESDLYKVYQSMDLVNLSEDDKATADKLPNVMKLRSLLYSAEWRKFMEDVTGLPEGTLSDRVDCACNCHATGGHLLCHDDVIGTRCISYILYLTDPDWKEEDGGALELYPKQEGKDEQAIPDVVPSKTVTPLFNQMAIFKVKAGSSFHAVQEVLGDKPRLSLQGWYHYKDTKKHEEEAAAANQLATLQLLKMTRVDDGDKKDAPTVDGQEAYVPFAVGEEEKDKATPVVSDKDKEYLSKYIDPIYFTPDALKEICQVFEEESSVQLQNFFLSDDDKMKAVVKAIEEDAGADGDKTDYRRGCSDDWKLVGPPHMQRFLEYQGKDGSKDTPAGTIGSTLNGWKKDVLESEAFGRFLNAITQCALKSRRGRIRQFRRGLDYTVAHYGLLLQPDDPAVLDATVSFVVPDKDDDKKKLTPVGSDKKEDKSKEGEKTETKDEDEEARLQHEQEDVTWESGNVGGFECYIEAEEDDEDGQKGEKKEKAPADEYSAEDDTQLLSVNPSHNTLSLVLRDVGTMRFVKYVSARAPSARWDIAMEYQIAQKAGSGSGADVEKKDA